MSKKIAVICSMVFAISGCTETVSKDMILGTYSHEKNGVVSELILHSDSSYTCKFKIPNEPQVYFESKWEAYENDQTGLRLSFDDFIFSPTRGIERQPVFFSPSADKRRGKIVICFDVDISTKEACYIKQE